MAESGNADPPPVVVVTGGGSGIGRSTAHRFAAAGFEVVALGRRMDPLIRTVDDSGADRARITPIVADVTDEQAVRRAFEQVDAVKGRVDILINSAGTFGRSAEPGDVTLQDWNEVIDANVTGTFLCSREAFHRMKSQQPQGGRIVTIGSVSAHAPRPGSIAYTASKHAVTGITKSIALDGRPYGIACSQLDIGNAATDMTRAFQQGTRQPDGNVLAEPVFDVDHVSDMLLHLARLPLDTNVLTMTLMASGMPFVGRG